MPTFGSTGTNYPSDTSGVVVPAGDDTGWYDTANTLYYFAPGTHTLAHSIIPGNNATYVGGYSDGAQAVINGGGSNANEFGQTATGVTVEYLTIENFWSPEGQDVVNANQAADDTFEYDTIGPDNPHGQASYDGYGIGVGDYDTIAYDCITGNSEGGFNASFNEGDLGKGIVIAYNEISYNALGDYPDNCGCAAGGKFFWTTDLVFTNNYVHDNYGVGVWADFNNAGDEISYNYIASNYSEAIDEEASYNSNISDNAVVGNGWASDGAWPACPGEPYSCTNGNGPVTGGYYDNAYSAIYLPNSGGDAAINSDYSGEFLVDGNILTNNFGGISIFEDPTRYCGQSNPNVDCILQAASSKYYINNPWVSTATVENGTTSLTSAGGFCIQTSGGCTAGTPTDGAYVYGSGIPAGDTVASCSSANACTLTTPATVSQTTAIAIGTPGGCGVYDLYGATRNSTTGSPSAEYYNECIWNSENVEVEGNQFNLNSSTVTGCTTSRDDCGYQTLISEEGERCASCYGFWNPWNTTNTQAATQVAEQNNNTWLDNAYTWTGSGEWQFQVLAQNNLVSASAWQASPFGQDAGSSGL